MHTYRNLTWPKYSANINAFKYLINEIQILMGVPPNATRRKISKVEL